MSGRPHPRTHYEHLARLFDYPGRDYPTWVRAAYDLLAGRYVLAAAHLDAFARALPTEGEPLVGPALAEVQEIFTRSFEVQAVTTLDIGYVMFGDDYKRGELLIHLSREHRAAGVDCGHELPDHLPNVLRLLARWEDRELAAELAGEILHPSLERMVAEFAPRRLDERNELYRKHFRTLIDASRVRGTMFREPLAATIETLRRDFDLKEWTPPERTSDFLGSLGRELEIEAADSRPTPTSGG